MQMKDGFILAMCKDSKILSSKLLLLHVPIISKWLTFYDLGERISSV